MAKKSITAAAKMDYSSEPFDPVAFGFDISASNQLSRLNWKLNRWKKTQEIRSLKEMETD